MTHRDESEPLDELSPADKMSLAIMQGDIDTFVEAYRESRSITAYRNIVLVSSKIGEVRTQSLPMYPFTYDLLKEIIDRETIFSERLSVWEDRISEGAPSLGATEIEKIAIDAASGEEGRVRDVMLFFAIETAYRLGKKYDAD